MTIFVLTILAFLVLVVLTQPFEVIKEIWRDIEEYENMKKVGYKPVHKQDGKNIPLSFEDFYIIGFIILFFGLIGYFFGLTF